ncbi:MAG TPA: inositol monophosphatase family protein, partial [Leptospiraceae bacterium]|nr:inositol monophosphatase family protein [Leptospiraceae bacterium]
YGKTGDGIGRIYLNQTVSKLSFRRNSSERKYRPDHILVSKSEHREGLYSDSFWKDQGNIVPKGSIAYKLALSALSESDICISLKPKNIWDICAGTAIINASGGFSVELKSFCEINYFNPAVTAPGILAGNPFIVMDYIRMYKKELSERRKEGW